MCHIFWTVNKSLFFSLWRHREIVNNWSPFQIEAVKIRAARKINLHSCSEFKYLHLAYLCHSKRDVTCKLEVFIPFLFCSLIQWPFPDKTKQEAQLVWFYQETTSVVVCGKTKSMSPWLDLLLLLLLLHIHIQCNNILLCLQSFKGQFDG